VVAAGVIGAAFPHLTVGVNGDLPGLSWHGRDRLAFPLGKVPSDGVDELVAGPTGELV
jgi:hypothetical protein